MFKVIILLVAISNGLSIPGKLIIDITDSQVKSCGELLKSTDYLNYRDDSMESIKLQGYDDLTITKEECINLNDA